MTVRSRTEVDELKEPKRRLQRRVRVDQAPRPPRLERWLLAAVVAATLARVAYVAAAPMVDVIYRSTDDAYYYFNVARNLVLGQGLTFDGINPTNGFHPLWMLCLLPVYGLFAADAELALRVTFALVAVLAGITVWTAYLAMRRYARAATAALAASILAAPVLLNTLINGLETGLLLFLLFATLAALASGNLLSLRSGRRENLFLGSLLGLVFLARLDTAFLIFGILGCIVYRWLRSQDAPAGRAALAVKFFQAGAAAAALVVPYLAWNLLRFGHMVPISGALKSSFPAVTFTLRRLSDPHTAFGTVLLVFSAGGLLWLGSWRMVPRYSLLVWMWVGCTLHYAYSLLFMHWSAHWWHFASYLPLTLLVVALVFDRLWSAVRWGRALAATGSLAAFVLGVVVDQAMRGDHHKVLHDAAAWARENLPEDATVGMTDSGIFGYFYGRRTVNLDGVINGYEYQAALRDGRLSEYLDSCGVTHIADYEVQYRNSRYVIRLPSRLYKTSGGGIIADQNEIYRSESYLVPLSRPGLIHFALWDISDLKILNDARMLNQR